MNKKSFSMYISKECNGKCRVQYEMFKEWVINRAFSVVGPSMWNGLPLLQRLPPRILSDTFYSSLKTLLFSHARVRSASE